MNRSKLMQNPAPFLGFVLYGAFNRPWIKDMELEIRDPVDRASGLVNIATRTACQCGVLPPRRSMSING